MTGSHRDDHYYENARFDIPPMDERDQRMPKVFGSGGAGGVGEGLVPLSLVGMMRLGNPGATAATITMFLSPPDRCRDVADAHRTRLLSAGSSTSSNNVDCICDGRM